MKCYRCQDNGDDNYQCQGGVCLCPYCYEKLIEEKLTYKETLRRLKTINKHAKNNKEKG